MFQVSGSIPNGHQFIAHRNDLSSEIVRVAYQGRCSKLTTSDRQELLLQFPHDRRLRLYLGFTLYL